MKEEDQGWAQEALDMAPEYRVKAEYQTLMKQLITSIKQALEKKQELPFSAYTSIKEQHLLNVPLIKPTIIFILNGQKELGRNPNFVCQAGDFVFFADSFGIDMRNIPENKEYFALLIEFEYQDFDKLEIKRESKSKHLVGNIDNTLYLTLQQFIQWSLLAPASMWSLRRKELLLTLYHLGYKEVASMAGKPSLTHKVHGIIREHIAEDVSTESVCHLLGMSESTLRRKLKLEDTNFQNLKDDVTLGQGLHYLQSTSYPIGYIAAECGYQSQSRFTQRFKQKFGLTPSDLRKTRMTG